MPQVRLVGSPGALAALQSPLHHHASLRSFRRVRRVMLLMGFAVLTLGTGWVTVQGATRNKNSTAANLTASGSWDTLPTANDVAAWISGSSVSNPLGGNLSLQGIKIDGVAGAVTITSGNTLTLGFNGIDLSAGAAQDLRISSSLALRDFTGQVWNIGAGRALTLDTGTFIRGTAATVNLRGTGSVSVASGYLTNTNGIIGAWFTQGTGVDTRFAMVDGTNKIVGHTTTAVAAASVTDINGTLNYDVNAVGTLGANASINTLRYSGVAGTLAGNFTTNGILNAGAGNLTVSGKVTVGSTKQLVLTVPDGTRNLILSGGIGDSAGGASDVVIANNTPTAGTVTLSGASDYTGTTYIQSGTVIVSHNNALGASDTSVNPASGTTVYTANRGRLQVTGNVTIAEVISFVGGDPNGTSQSSLVNGTGTNTLTGQLRLVEGVRIGGSGAGNVLNIKGGIVTTGGDRQLVFNPSSSTVNISDNAVDLGTAGTFYFDQVGLVTVAVAGNRWGRTIVGGGGTLRLLASDVLPSTAVLQMGVAYNTSTSTLDLNGFNQTIGKLEQSTATPGVVTSASAATLTVNQSASGFFTGQITGQVKLVKDGTATLQLSGNNTHRGDTVVKGGVLEISSVTTSSDSDATTTLNTNVISGVDTSKLLVGQAVTGDGIMAGSYITVVSANSITISRNASATAVGTAQLSFGALTGSLSGSTVDYDGQGGSIAFGAYTTTTQFGGLKGSQNLALVNKATAGVALSVGGNDQSTTYTGVLSGTGGSVNKEGTGTFEVTGNNTYTAGTTVSKGTFLANNTAGSATGSGSVSTVASSGARLGGTGSITGGASQNISLGAGTFLMVGSSHGVSGGVAQDLVLGNSAAVTNVAINLAGTLQFDLFANDGAGIGNPLGENDVLKLFSSSTVDLTGSSIDIAALGMDPLTWNIGDTWMLIDWSGVTNATKTSGTPLLSSMPALAADKKWTSYSDATGFYVQVAAIPEPGKAALLMLGLAACFLRRRRIAAGA